MIDIRNKNLDLDVFKLYLKMFDLSIDGSVSRFKTERATGKRWKWECRLEIPDFPIANGKGNTEVEAINYCASNMLAILESKNGKHEFDSVHPKSIMKEMIEERFGDVNYDSNYLYRLATYDTLIDDCKKSQIDYFSSYIEDAKINLLEDDDEIERTLVEVKVNFVLKREKNKDSDA